MSLFTNQSPQTSGAPFGLRQRRDPNINRQSDENLHPNPRNDQPKSTAVRAPPKLFLATAGKSAFRTAISTTVEHKPETSQALTIIPQQQHWIAAYGHQTPSQLQCLLSRLSECGTVISTRMSKHNPWIALQYDSALSVHKARCQDGCMVNVGGSVMILGVIALEGDGMVRLGLDGSKDEDGGMTLLRKRMEGSGGSMSVREEEEVLLVEDGDEETDRLGMDSVCGKVLGWFFNW
jgi:hypothetical protein